MRSGTVLNGADIGGHVIADHAVATGGGADQQAVFVGDDDGQAIEFGFQHIIEHRHPQGAVCGCVLPRRAGRLPSKALARLSTGAGCVTLGKSSERSLPGALGRRIRRDQFGMLFFQVPQFVIQPVVFGIGDDRIAEDIVAIDVIMKLFAQFRCALGEDIGHKPTLLWQIDFNQIG